jgi:hypothetical protein
MLPEARRPATAATVDVSRTLTLTGMGAYHVATPIDRGPVCDSPMLSSRRRPA